MLFVAMPAHAQSKAKKMVEQPDTVPLFRGLAVSVDAIGLGQMVLGSYGQYEAALRINLKDKYFPVLELGYGCTTSPVRHTLVSVSIGISCATSTTSIASMVVCATPSPPTSMM